MQALHRPTGNSDLNSSLPLNSSQNCKSARFQQSVGGNAKSGYSSRPGPLIGGVCLGKSNDNSETRLCAPYKLADRASVHALLRGWIKLAELCPTSHQRASELVVCMHKLRDVDTWAPIMME